MSVIEVNISSSNVTIDQSFNDHSKASIVKVANSQKQSSFLKHSEESTTSIKTSLCKEDLKNDRSQSRSPSLNSLGNNSISKVLSTKNTECKTDICLSQDSNSSAKEDVLTVTKASPLYVARVIPHRIHNAPDVIRPKRPIKLPNITDKIIARMQLQSDEQKLIKSILLTPSTYLDMIGRYSKKNHVSTGMQTSPVLILPILTLDILSSTDSKILEMIKLASQDSKSSEESQMKTTEFKPKIHTIQQETQAPPVLPKRIKTISSTPHCRDKESSDGILETFRTITCDNEDKTASDVYWGDVYNDYKVIQLEEEDEISSKGNIKPKIENMPKMLKTQKNKKILTVRSTRHRNSLKARYMLKLNKVNLAEGENDTIEEENYERFFVLHQFDEVVKSYLSLSDRRIRSVCAKTCCDIKMYGPIVQYHSDKSKLSSLPLHMKTYYYITVNSFSKDNLEKAIKCLQETFPTAYFYEKCNKQPFLELCGDQIPI